MNNKEIKVTTKEIKDSTYIRVRVEVQKWPEWKKEAYDNTFAKSIHARKLAVK